MAEGITAWNIAEFLLLIAGTAGNYAVLKFKTDDARLWINRHELWTQERAQEQQADRLMIADQLSTLRQHIMDIERRLERSERRADNSERRADNQK